MIQMTKSWFAEACRYLLKSLNHPFCVTYAGWPVGQDAPHPVRRNRARVNHSRTTRWHTAATGA